MSKETKLLPFQAQGVELIDKFGGRALLADEMGLGKSIQALYYSLRRCESKRVLVICPASLKYNWADECKRHFGIAAEVLNGRRVREARLVSHQPVMVVNYEILDAWIPYLLKVDLDVVIIDEIHYLMNPESQRSKAVKRYVAESRIPKRIGLSGTPFDKRPFDLWMILNVIKPKMFPSMTEFGWLYCGPTVRNGQIEYNGSTHAEELNKRLRTEVMIRRTKKEVYAQLPDKRYESVMIALTNKARKEYLYCQKRFKRWLLERFPSAYYTAKDNLDLVRVGYTMRLIAKLKRHAVIEWIWNFLEASSSKLVVFSMHRKMIDYVHSKFPDSSLIIDGRIDVKDRHIRLRTFQKDPKCRMLVCHYKAAGVGLNMTSAADVLLIDRPFTPGVRSQAEDRVHRIGQDKKCTIWSIVARDTYEEFLEDMLSSRLRRFNNVIDDNSVEKSLLKRMKKESQE